MGYVCRPKISAVIISFIQDISSSVIRYGRAVKDKGKAVLVIEHHSIKRIKEWRCTSTYFNGTR
jgi:hypothetical protein